MLHMQDLVDSTIMLSLQTASQETALRPSVHPSIDLFFLFPWYLVVIWIRIGRITDAYRTTIRIFRYLYNYYKHSLKYLEYLFIIKREFHFKRASYTISHVCRVHVIRPCLTIEMRINFKREDNHKIRF